MAFDVGSIIGHMVLDTKTWNSAVATVKNQTMTMQQEVKKLSQEWIDSGKHLDRFGNKLALIGSLGLAPFALAIKNVAKENFALQNQLDKISDSFLSVQRDLAQTLIPWMEKLTNGVVKLSAQFNSLNPAIKEFIVNFIVVTSLLTLSSGLIIKTYGLLKLLAGAFLAAAEAMLVFALENPFTAILLVVVGATWTIIKFKDQLLKLWEVLKITFGEGFKALLEGIAIGLLKLTEFINFLVQKIPFIPKAVKEALDVSGDIKEMIANLSSDFQSRMATIGQAWQGFMGGGVQSAQRVQTAWEQSLEGIKKGIHDLQKQYDNWGEFAKNKTMEIAQSMESFFATQFFDLMTNKFQGFKQMMVGLGNLVLQVLAQIAARMMIVFALRAALAPVTGGASLALFGFADGTEEVPSPGIYKLHGGEKVIPKYDAGSKNGKTGLTIYNLISSEAVALAMQSKAGQGVIVNVINSNSLRNGVVRREVANR